MKTSTSVWEKYTKLVSCLQKSYGRECYWIPFGKILGFNNVIKHCTTLENKSLYAVTSNVLLRDIYFILWKMTIADIWTTL